MMTVEKSPKIVAIIQARMGSTRLPGKVLLPVNDRPVLAWVVERVKLAETIDQIVVATTDHSDDQPVVDLCRRAGYRYVRGDQYDVLDRYYQAARESRAEVVVRITGDCPLIDPGVIDKTVNAFLQAQPACDFAANRLPPPGKRTYPIGLDTEVCSFQALHTAWEEAEEPHQREHVMPYLYEEEGRFNVVIVDHHTDLGGLRWTVDTPQDLKLIRKIVEKLDGRLDFGWLEVVNLIKQEPELALINEEVEAKNFFDYQEQQE